MALISRDPFARSELHRTTVENPNKLNCDWCGNYRANKHGKVLHLFAYQTESDGGRVTRHSGAFCSLGCFCAYNNR